MGGQLGALAEDGGVDVLDAPALCGDDLRHPAGQHEAVRPGVLLRRIGEVLADVAQRCRAQHGIHHRMGQHIGVRVAQQALLIGHLHAAKDELAALHQTMDVVTMTNAHLLSSVLRPGQVFPGRDLDVCVVALHQLHRTAR